MQIMRPLLFPFLIGLGLSHGTSLRQSTKVGDKDRQSTRRLMVSELESYEHFTTFELSEMAIKVNPSAHAMLGIPADETLLGGEPLLGGGVAPLRTSDENVVDFVVEDVVRVGRFLRDPYDNSTLIRVGDFIGNLSLSPSGNLMYQADFHGIGTQVFDYTACSDVDPTECVDSTAAIDVEKDPMLPDSPPQARGGTWSVEDGSSLSISAPGFMANDDGFGYYLTSPSQSLNGLLMFNSFDGGLDTFDDGSFEYRARKCWTGTESFSYEVCYSDFPSVCSMGVTVIEVKRNEMRPEPPSLESDDYTVMEGVTLVEGSGSLFQNDHADKNQPMFVADYDYDSSFRGRLEVNRDGGFEYRPAPAELGDFYFTYEACYADWECVPCRTTNVRITVERNPDKPSTPPTPRDDFMIAEQYVEVEGNCTANVEYDERYHIYVEDGGGVHVHSDGYMHDTFDEMGNDTFTVKVCYEEWPDLCAQSNLTIVTKPPPPLFTTASTARQGVSSAYLVHWAGRRDGRRCYQTEPSVILSCRNGGEVSLIEMDHSDNDLCHRPRDSLGNPIMNLLNCSADYRGEIYAECRDRQANDFMRRELVVTMHSEPVECDEMDSTFHAVWLNTWCNTTANYTSSAWQSSGAMGCSGTLMTDENGETMCYEYALGKTPQPADVIVSPSNYESCYFLHNYTSSRRLSEAAYEKFQDRNSPLNDLLH